MKKKMKKVLVLLLVLTLLVPGYGVGTFAAPKNKAEEPVVVTPVPVETGGVEIAKLYGDYDFSSVDRQTVIVELNEESIIAAKHHGKSQTKENLASVRRNIISKVNQVVSNAKIKREYDFLVSGFALEIAENEIPNLLGIEGVKAIYPNVHYTTAEVGAPRILSAEEIGPNMFDSAPFIGAPEAWKLGYTGKGITVAVIDTGVDYNHPALAHAFGVYKGYDFFDNDPDPMEVEGEYHGTHVSGTVAGKDESDNFFGIAPEATLLGYRVLGPDGGSSEGVIAGIEQAVKDGADIMNLSLGNTLNAPDYMTSIALDWAMAEGVVAITSNGNAGPENWTVGSPGTSREAISVGATMQPYNVYNAKLNISDGGNYPTAVMGFPTDDKLKSLNGKTYSIVIVGLGRAQDLTGIDLTGKVALIQRGEIPFVEKAENAYAKGAVAALIYDHTSGNVMPDIPGTAIPTFKLTKEVGEALVKSLSRSKTPLTVGFEIAFSARIEETIADFSSRGPVVETWMIKPDLSAPGVDIVSAFPGGGYASLQGTSMASPHVAGAAALILQAHPNYTPEQVKAALMNTAVTVNEPLKTTPYPLNAQGAGSIRVVDAIDSKVLVTPSSHSFGVLYPTDGAKSFTKTFKVFNTGKGKQTYQLSASFTNRSSAIAVKVPASITVANEASFNLTLSVDPSGLKPGYYEGEVILLAGDESFNIPIIFFVGEPDYPVISHAGLEVIDNQPIVWGYLPMGADQVVVQLYKENGSDLNYYGTTHMASNLPADFFEFSWDGTLNGSKLSPGTYYLIVFATKGNVTDYLIAYDFVIAPTKGGK